MKSQSEGQDTLISLSPDKKAETGRQMYTEGERLYMRLGIEIHIHRQRESKTQRGRESGTNETSGNNGLC